MIQDFIKSAKETADRAPRILRHLAQRNHPQYQNELNLRFFGRTTPDFRQAMMDAYGLVPESVRHYLDVKGAKIAIGGTRDDIRPDRAEAFRKATKDDLRVHQNQSSGVFMLRDNTVGITQYEYDTKQIPEPYSQPGFLSILKKNWRIMKASYSQDILRHEVGHAFDFNNQRISLTSGFKEAYDKDVAALGGGDNARHAGWGYYIQDDVPALGREEVFAETWASIHGGGCDGHDIDGAFPSSLAWVKQYQNKFQHAYDHGPKAVRELIYDTHNPISEMKAGNDHFVKATKQQADLGLETGSTWLSLGEESNPSLVNKVSSLAKVFEQTPETVRETLRLALAKDAISSSIGAYTDPERLKSVIRQTGQANNPNLTKAAHDLSNYLLEHSDREAVNFSTTRVRELKKRLPELERHAANIGSLLLSDQRFGLRENGISIRRQFADVNNSLIAKIGKTSSLFFADQAVDGLKDVVKKSGSMELYTAMRSYSESLALHSLHIEDGKPPSPESTKSMMFQMKQHWENFPPLPGITGAEMAHTKVNIEIPHTGSVKGGAPRLNENFVHGVKGGVVGAIAMGGVVAVEELLNGASLDDAASAGGNTAYHGLVPDIGILTKQQGVVDRVLNWADAGTLSLGTGALATAAAAGTTAAVTAPLGLTGAGAAVPTTAAGVAAGSLVIAAAAGTANLAIGLVSDATYSLGLSERSGIIHGGIGIAGRYVSGIERQIWGAPDQIVERSPKGNDLGKLKAALITPTVAENTTALNAAASLDPNAAFAKMSPSRLDANAVKVAAAKEPLDSAISSPTREVASTTDLPKKNLLTSTTPKLTVNAFG